MTLTLEFNNDGTDGSTQVQGPLNYITIKVIYLF